MPNLSPETYKSMISTFLFVKSKLKGEDRREFLARLCKELGRGGQSLIAETLGVSRKTINLGIHELESGVKCVDGISLRHRKLIEDHLPLFLEDLKEIIDSPTPLGDTRTKLTVRKIRELMISQKGYTDQLLPSNQTIYNKAKKLGYRFR